MIRRRDIKRLPSAEFLRTALDYDPETGALTWKKREEKTDSDVGFNRRVGGKPAGTIGAKGYVVVGFRIDGKLVYFLAHRIIWKMVTGEEPADQIDHENTNRADNRWANLREATNGQNRHNSRLASNNTSGVKGVSWDKWHRLWNAQVTMSGKLIRAGRFHCFGQAVVAVKALRTEIHGSFARTN